jgi:hypothetical protein
MECVYCGVSCDWPWFASAPICLGCAAAEVAEQDAAYQGDEMTAGFWAIVKAEVKAYSAVGNDQDTA